jgi:tRNA(Arg) A34 adenosine deaminase TadA
VLSELILPPKLLLDASRLAQTSPYGRFRLGAIIARKKSVISYGVNSKRTHPLQHKFSSRPHISPWLHAEVHAISLARVGDLIDADIYVARIIQDGTIANSRPCEGCLRALHHYGISRMWYYDNGKFYKECL